MSHLLLDDESVAADYDNENDGLNPRPRLELEFEQGRELKGHPPIAVNAMNSSSAFALDIPPSSSKTKAEVDGLSTISVATTSFELLDDDVQQPSKGLLNAGALLLDEAEQIHEADLSLDTYFSLNRPYSVDEYRQQDCEADSSQTPPPPREDHSHKRDFDVAGHLLYQNFVGEEKRLKEESDRGLRESLEAAVGEFLAFPNLVTEEDESVDEEVLVDSALHENLIKTRKGSGIRAKRSTHLKQKQSEKSHFGRFVSNSAGGTHQSRDTSGDWQIADSGAFPMRVLLGGRSKREQGSTAGRAGAPNALVEGRDHRAAGRGTSGGGTRKKMVRAKHNQMYLITSQHSNGIGGGQGSSSGLQPLPGLINKVLPKELILRIFSYLDIVSLCRCAQVCRGWNRLAMDGSNWQDVDLFCFQRDVRTAVVENLAKRCGGFLKGLSLKGCENVQDSAMRSFAIKCPNIERLTLNKCKLITDATCEYIGRYCHRLIVLELENCTAITDLTMKFISEGCKRLEELNVSWCEQITDLGIVYVTRGCPSLGTLICKGCEGLSANCFGHLQHELKPLRKLSLLSCSNVTDETVDHIANKCHKLEFLSLSNCKEITDQALLAISQGCPNIRDLELAGCQNLTDAGFVSLSKNCHELERMDLEECVLITDSTLINLHTGCPNLSSLSLSHCENLTDNGLAELCNTHKDRLQILELDNCPNITDASLDSMKALRLLERVDLYDCQMITKDAIKRFKELRPEVEVHAYFAPATPPAPAPPVRRGICRCCAII